MRKLVLVAAIVAIGAHAAFAVDHFVKVAPNPVKRGATVRVYGSVGTGCASAQVTLYSRAFKGATTQSFAGVPAVFTRQRSNHSFSTHVTIRRAVRRGRYSLGGRCGGGNFGHATLRVS